MELNYDQIFFSFVLSDTEAEKNFPLEHQYNIEHGLRPVMGLAVDRYYMIYYIII